MFLAMLSSFDRNSLFDYMLLQVQHKPVLLNVHKGNPSTFAFALDLAQVFENNYYKRRVF
jgi:hypothetical protein